MRQLGIMLAGLVFVAACTFERAPTPNPQVVASLASVDDGAIIGAGTLTQLGADAVEVYVELRDRTARNAMQMGDGCAADPAGPVIPLVPLVDGASWTRFGGRLRDFAGLSIRVLAAGGRVVACGTFWVAAWLDRVRSGDSCHISLTGLRARVWGPGRVAAGGSSRTSAGQDPVSESPGGYLAGSGRTVRGGYSPGFYVAGSSVACPEPASWTQSGPI